MKDVEALATCASLAVLLMAAPAWSEWRIPKNVAIDLASEIAGSEQQAALLLSAAAGTNGCERASNLKVATKFDAKAAVIEILGYDFTPGPRRTDVACTANLVETRAKVPIPNTWLKPGTENRIVFAIGSSKSEYVIKRDGFRVELLPLKTTNVVIQRLPTCYTLPAATAVTVLWPADFGVLYLAGSVESGQDYRAALRAFAKTQQMIPADEVQKSLPEDCPMTLSVRVLSGTVPPIYSARRIGALPGFARVEVFLKAPSDFELANSWLR